MSGYHSSEDILPCPVIDTEEVRDGILGVWAVHV
jgi:hypothetical protein